MSEQIPAGFYKGRAIAGSEQYGTTANGAEQIVLDIDCSQLGRSFSTFLHFTEAAMPYAIERLRACGWQGNDISKLVGIDTNEITFEIKYETYQGKTRMKVDIATGGGRVKLENQMDDRAKRAFAARMQAFLKSNGGAAPAQQKAPAKSPPQRSMAQQNSDNDFGGEPFDSGSGSDEIPFATAADRTPRHLRMRRLWERF